MSIIEETLNRLDRERAAGTSAPFPMQTPRIPQPGAAQAGEVVPDLIAGVRAANAGAMTCSCAPTGRGPRLAGAALIGVSVVSSLVWFGLEQADVLSAQQRNPAPAAAVSGVVRASGHPAEQSPIRPPEQHAAPNTAADPAPTRPGAATASLAPASAAPPWLSEGRSRLAAGDTSGALGAWRKGFNTLSPRQRLVAVAAFRDRTSALAGLAKLGVIPDAFVIPGIARGAEAWWLLALSSPGRRHADVRLAGDLLGTKGGAITTAGAIAPIPASPVPPVAARPLPAEAALAAREQNRSEPWLSLGKAELGQGNTVEAERHLARAVELDPDLTEAWTLRGIAAQEHGDHEQALTFLAEALRLAPGQADIHFNIGYSLDALGRRSEAEPAWRRFLELAGDSGRYARKRAYAEQRLAPLR